VRREMEIGLGADFSNVRIHVSPEATALGALAFTVGSDVYFAPSRYAPGTIQGKRLLAHELVHVLQQRTGRVRHPFSGAIAVVHDPALEAEAERLATRVASGGRTQRPAERTAQPALRKAPSRHTPEAIQQRQRTVPPLPAGRHGRVIQRMVLSIGNDPATAGAAGDMVQSGNYGARVRDANEISAQLRASDKTLHIVAHTNAHGVIALGEESLHPDDMAKQLVEDLGIFSHGNKISTIVLHACYSEGVAYRLALHLGRILQEKGLVHLQVTVQGTQGLNVLDPTTNDSRVVAPKSLGDSLEEEAQAYDDLLKGGKISVPRFNSTVRPHLMQGGWTTYRTQSGGRPTEV
jgi:Domain of unknown function (DUF4157)